MSSQIRNVLIGGGTGKVGYYLIKHLKKQGYNVSLISRNAKNISGTLSILNMLPGTLLAKAKDDFADVRMHTWKDIRLNGIPHETDVVINLAGKTIASPGMFTDRFKKQLRSSRIETTETLAAAIAKSDNPPQKYITASAVGIYENREDKVYTEDDEPCRPGRHTFFTQLCADWEKASLLPDSHSTQVAQLRLGVVLAEGTLPMTNFLPSALTGVLGVTGSGKQPFPWIHISDVVRSIEFILQEEIAGPVNLVAPEVITNEDLVNTLVEAVGSKKGTAMPGFFMELLFGKERAENLLLDSPKALPKKLLDSGFEFNAPTIAKAMEIIIDDIINHDDDASVVIKAFASKLKQNKSVNKEK